jgi:hypothetical protein
MTRCLGCRARFTPAREHHRLCWSCWRAMRGSPRGEISRRRDIAALCRDGVDFETAYTLVTELGARLVNGRAA